ncbi:hypothetical protein [Francisella sp. XLW-1]|uniref:hypothetical protein n=1 Tax=Francisella sp. XLW-1 TaxID=2610887 RepID=UPI00123E22CF|nr:hypothetical protein [Francisella sp. XLW-1]
MSKKLLIIVFIVTLYGCNNKQQSNHDQANKEVILQINKASSIKKDKLQQVLENAKKHFDISAISLSALLINDKRPVSIVAGDTSINSN